MRLKSFAIRLAFFLMVIFNGFVFAQPLTKTIALTVPGTSGYNAGAVVWHPAHKKYFTYMCGNASFPMADFDEKGTPFITEAEKLLITGVDLRGLWYNTANRRLEFNGHNTTGIGHYHLNRYGVLDSIYTDVPGMNQPYANSIGFYNTDMNIALFPSEDFIVYKYVITKENITPEKVVALQLGCTKQSEVDALDDNEWKTRKDNRNRTVQYTGIANKEYAVVNVAQHLLEFYSAKTGLLTKTQVIPDIVPLKTYFNFSYANKIWWFFNTDTRTWLGYK